VVDQLGFWQLQLGGEGAVGVSQKGAFKFFTLSLKRPFFPLAIHGCCLSVLLIGTRYLHVGITMLRGFTRFVTKIVSIFDLHTFGIFVNLLVFVCITYICNLLCYCVQVNLVHQTELLMYNYFLEVLGCTYVLVFKIADFYSYIQYFAN
jgi:hypothetical protein